MHAGIFVSQWREALEARGTIVQCLRPEGSVGPAGDIEYRMWGQLLAGQGAPDTFSNAPLRESLTGIIQSLSLAKHVYDHGSSADIFVGHWLLPWGLFLPKTTPSHLYAHGSDIALLEALPARVARLMARRIDTSATGISFVSGHLKTRYLKCLDQPSTTTLSIVPMGVYECDREESMYQDLLSFKGHRVLAVAMGRHVELKGFDLLIESAQDMPNLCLALGGTGPSTAKLMALSRRLGVDVKFIGAYTPHQRSALLEAADVFVQPSRQIGKRQEGCPVTVLEAMNSGTPCFLSDTLGHLDLVNQNGLRMFPCEGISQLRHLLQSFCESPEFRLQSHRHAEVFKQSFAWEKQITRHEEALYKSMARNAELPKPQTLQI